MKPLQALPEGYVKKGTLDLNQDKRAMILLNVAGLALLVLSGWLFTVAAINIRPEDAASGIKFQIISTADLVRVIVAVLAITAVMLVLHEAVHGLFFWLFTGARPVFGLGWGYAYAAAPGWYLPRDLYFVVGVAPLVVLSLVGLLLLTVVPTGWLTAVVALMTFNASGAVGDLAVAIWLLLQPSTCLANDHGDAVTLYVPE